LDCVVGVQCIALIDSVFRANNCADADNIVEV
jgi:hypothetical protein